MAESSHPEAGYFYDWAETERRRTAVEWPFADLQWDVSDGLNVKMCDYHPLYVAFCQQPRVHGISNRQANVKE